MSTVLAVRNMVHDRVRLVVTLIGIVFAVVLIGVQLGLFIGFARTTSSLIDHAGADLWIMAPGTRNIDQSAAISERKLFQALAVPGIQEAAKLITEFTLFKRPDGGNETVIVVGFDPAQGLGAPWQVAEGDVKNLAYAGTVMIDELYREKLGVTRIGQIVEIGGRRAQVVGFTRGIRSFTQSPYVFASFASALDYSRIRSDQTKYVLCRLVPGADAAAMRKALSERLGDVEVLTSGEFSRRTQFYWMFTTGAGLALLVAALMGLAVGVVVVSQTLYATTIDHLPEFGTLRAIGASSRYLYGVIIRQAVLSALAGYGIGLGVTLAIIRASRNGGTAILLPGELAAGLLALTLVMCVGAAAISIRKVTRLDPAMVFK
ncbi:MAG TPA: ABC transporter permease [Stellaceae bacterium]|nr:ABC transporter permease [Stellaceae bacterium]